MLASEPSDGWTTAQVAPTANRSHAQRLVVIAVVVLGSRSAAVFAAEDRGEGSKPADRAFATA